MPSVVSFKNKKPIRSFVRREGRLTSGQQRALTELWPRYGMNACNAAINMDAAFQRQAPKVLEIGFGNGESLARTASAHPEIDFIGIEVHRPGVGHLLHLLEKDNIDNVRVICDDAGEVIERNIADHSLQQISIFFPDPWPKKRHHKRRLIQTPFVTLLSTKLSSQGVLHIATDWEDYAGWIEEVMQTMSGFSQVAIDQALPRLNTKYEQRGLRKGHQVWDLVYCLKG